MRGPQPAEIAAPELKQALAGVEERIVLRLQPDWTVTFERETGAFSIPGKGVTLNLPPPPSVVGMPSDDLKKNMESLLKLIVDSFPKSPESDTDIGPVKRHILADIHPKFQTPYADQVSSSDWTQFVTAIQWDYFFRIGPFGETFSIFRTAEGGAFLTRFQFLEPWRQVPCLGGHAATYATRATHREGPLSVLGVANYHWWFVDPEAARQHAENWYQDILQVPPPAETGVISELQRVLPEIHRDDADGFRYHFGEHRTELEEKRHAEDALWAFHFFGRDFRRHSWANILIAESLIRPGGHLDLTAWSPMKARQLFDSPETFIETAGQLGAVIEGMWELLDQGRDPWAYALFLYYFLEKIQESTGRTAGLQVPGYQGGVPRQLFDFFARKGFSGSGDLIAYLNQSGLAPESAKGPGQRALLLLSEFYRENFLTDREREQMLFGTGSASAGVEERALFRELMNPVGAETESERNRFIMDGETEASSRISV